MMTDKVYLDHKPETVALICMGPSVLDYLEASLTQEFKMSFADEIWALNMAANCFHHDVCFWLDDLKNQHDFRPDLIQWLARRGKPVITSTRRPELVPLSFDFPIDDVFNIAFPIFGKPYLNNGVAMAVAYAIVKGVKTLKIYGADFSYPNRDFAESGRACVECWITLASNKFGMRVELCPKTSLMDIVKDHGVYGYDEQPVMTMPDGGTFQYVRQGGASSSATIGKYTYMAAEPGAPALHNPNDPFVYQPEDSSGGSKEQGNGRTNGQAVPGVAGDSAAPAGIGAVEPGPGPAEAGAVARPRKGFWSRKNGLDGRHEGSPDAAA